MPPLQLSVCVGGGGGGGGVLENEIGLYPTHNKMEGGLGGIMLHLFQAGGGGGGVLCSTYFRWGRGLLIILHP